MLKALFNAYFEERKKKKIEESMPDVLFQASLFSGSASMEKIMEFIAEAGLRFISDEFRQALNEVRKGASIEESLKGINERCRSQVVERVINLLVQGYRSGAEMNKVFKECAEDILSTQQIIKERNAAMLVERYTLFFAGGLLVPAVLGLIAGLVKRLDFTGLSSLDLGLGNQLRGLLLENALLGNQVYIMEYALIASCFIALQENHLRKAVVYAVILMPSALLAYHLGSLMI